MEYFSTLAIVLTLALSASFYLLIFNPRRRAKLPPGPYPFPLIGNILQLGLNLHQSLTDLSKTYGPLMSLHLGSVYTVVVSSPDLAKQVLQEHDQLFSGRTIIAAVEAHDFHKHSMGFMPIGDRWRRARKICREYMFSTQRLDASQGLRREKLRKLCGYVHECSLRGGAVDLGDAAFITSLNMTTAALFSVDFAEFGSDAARDLREPIDRVTRVLGAPNVADLFPFLKPIDPQGIRRRTAIYIGKILGIFEDIIDRRLETKEGFTGKNDLLETLLQLREGSEYELSIRDIKYLFLDLVLGGPHTTTSTVEWVMTELLVNPDKMIIAKNEVRSVIEETEQVEESDIPRLPYLQAVIKETFRLHPPGPILVPRRSVDAVEISGYTIPKNAQIFVNIWAMGRDSSIWPNPSAFEPERFLNSKIDFKGHDFTLIPFGTGRRICPALALADRMVHVMVASLIHNFDWKLEAGMEPQDVDTSDKFGLALRKAVPVKAIPIHL